LDQNGFKSLKLKKDRIM